MLMTQDFARAQVAYRQQRIAEDFERTSRWGVRRRRPTTQQHDHRTVVGRALHHLHAHAEA
jgi:hypothetical protein